MRTTIAVLCREHEQWLQNHPKRGDLKGLMLDNGADEDEAEVITDAILDLMDDHKIA